MDIRKIAFIALMPFAASAETASYQYLDLSMQVGGEIDFGGGSVDTEGYSLKGSLPFGESLFLALDYDQLETDPSGLDLTGYTLALGMHGETFYGQLGYESAEIDACGILFPPCTTEGNGYSLELGMRSMMSERVEFNARIGYADLGDFDTLTSYGAGGVFNFTEHIGLSINYDIRSGDDVEFVSYGLGLRMTF